MDEAQASLVDYDGEDVDIAAVMQALMGPAPDEATAERYDALVPTAQDAVDWLEANPSVSVTVTFTGTEARRTLIALGVYAYKTGLQADIGGESLDAVDSILASADLPREGVNA